MKIVKRETYLKRIRPFYDSEMIKVITGMRRSGKSYLMLQIIDELKDMRVPTNNIIYVNLEDFENRSLLNDESLFAYIKSKLINRNKYYIFIDEIQNVKGFERVINSFRSTNNCSIFITGSNGMLLSGELATLLSGRIVNFKVLPFKFSEFVEFNNHNKNLDKLLSEYMIWGGIPLVCQIDINSKYTMLGSIYDTIVLKDVINRTNTKSISSLESVIDYLIANSGKTISGKRIANALNNNGYNVSVPSVYEYINNTVNACIIDKIPRYDIKGKKRLAFEEKVYVKDLGFYRLKKDRATKDAGAIVETIVYNELIARGYRIYIGKITNGEVDFIVENNEEKFYVQVCYLLSDEKVVQREFGAFKDIDDNFPKYVISMDKILINRSGIIHKNLIDFLMEEI